MCSSEKVKLPVVADLDSLDKADVLVNQLGKDEEVGVGLVDVHRVALLLGLRQLCKDPRQCRVLL